MTKGEIIKELHGRGIRRGTKQGVGEVSLSHLKIADLYNLLFQAREKDTDYYGEIVESKDMFLIAPLGMSPQNVIDSLESMVERVFDIYHYPKQLLHRVHVRVRYKNDYIYYGTI